MESWPHFGYRQVITIQTFKGQILLPKCNTQGGARCTASIVHQLWHTHYNLSNPPSSSLTPTEPCNNLPYRFCESFLQCCVNSLPSPVWSAAQLSGSSGQRGREIARLGRVTQTFTVRQPLGLCIIHWVSTHSVLCTNFEHIASPFSDYFFSSLFL